MPERSENIEQIDVRDNSCLGAHTAGERGGIVRKVWFSREDVLEALRQLGMGHDLAVAARDLRSG